MNRRIYAAASRLSDEARRAERGLFWGSIHGTLNHLLWGDRQWMSRFAGWPKPEVGLKQSAALIDSFSELAAARVAADAALQDWAETVAADWLQAEQTWFSGAAGREMRQGRPILVTHLFNHQTHHRGQVHAALTACGERTGDTDLFLLITDG